LPNQRKTISEVLAKLEEPGNLVRFAHDW
jgi:hypothetical protein